MIPPRYAFHFSSFFVYGLCIDFNHDCPKSCAFTVFPQCDCPHLTDLRVALAVRLKAFEKYLSAAISKACVGNSPEAARTRDPSTAAPMVGFGAVFLAVVERRKSRHNRIDASIVDRETAAFIVSRDTF